MTPEEQLLIANRSMSLALRILNLGVECGIDKVARMNAAREVLRVGLARSEGEDRHISDDTKRVLDAVLSNIEMRLMFSRIGVWDAL